MLNAAPSPATNSLRKVQSLFCGLALALACGSSPAAAGETAADMILTNARIYTVDDNRPWADALAIREGKVAAVGTAEEVLRTRAAGTRVVDLDGRLVMPAFGDAHVHPVIGGMNFSRCPLHAGTSLDDYRAIVAECVKHTPGDGVVYGAGWEDSLFPPNGIPRKEVLDQVSTTRPLIFKSVGGHSLWLNSKALELAGITRDTPDPVNGHIDRDPATGEPVGGLQEAAMRLAGDLIPKPSAEEMQNSILYVAKEFNRMGIVSWHDAGIEFDADGASAVLDAYRAVKDRGALTSYVSIAFKWKNELGLDQLPALIEASERARTAGLDGHAVKFYVDGVIPQRTAYMLAPYEGSTTERGKPQIPQETLRQAITQVDARGLQAHVHAIGDGAVRAGLDAIEAARQANGATDNRHMISHLNVVDPADQPRFGKLGVFAQFQPLWASWYPYMELTEQAIGKARMGSIYPAGSIVRSGGKLAYGADWPVASANPFEGLEVAVTRRNENDSDAKPLLADEGISLPEAVESYTINVALVNRNEDVTGSITPGKNADLVVLDRNIFEIPIYEVSETKVLVTLFKGQPVHGNLGKLDPED